MHQRQLRDTPVPPPTTNPAFAGELPIADPTAPRSIQIEPMRLSSLDPAGADQTLPNPHES